MSDFFWEYRMTEPRVFISTDIGGGDADDIQSLVHVMYYLDEVDLRGIVASPSADSNRSPNAGLQEINNVISSYAEDFDNLKTWGDYPTPKSLREISFPGASRTLEEGGKFSQSSPGAEAIAREAKAASPNDKLHVAVWGSPTDVAIALKHHPEIADSLVVYTISGNGGANSDKIAMDKIKSFDDLILIDNNRTFRGMYAWNSKTYGTPYTFPSEFVEHNHQTGQKRNSALAQHFMDATEQVSKDILKMGDMPSFLYLIDDANNNNPTLPSSWGGQFVRQSGNHYTDRKDMAATPAGRSKPIKGAGTISRHADDFLEDWVSRLVRAERKNRDNGNDQDNRSNQDDGNNRNGQDDRSERDDRNNENPNNNREDEQDVLTGSAGNDILKGQNEDEVFIGVNPNSSNPGRGERDLFKGRGGNDIFILGNESDVFYDDDDSSSSHGWDGRGVIADFDTDDDLIQLSEVGNYQAEYINGSTHIFEVSDRTEEVIGVARGVNLNLQNSDHFVFV
ncbi:MAG: nucleoside hydrolase-like domain-containing protein [Microcoleaceae cyanobacterium]